MYDIKKHPGGYAGEHKVAINIFIEAGGLYGPDNNGYISPPPIAKYIAGRAAGDANNIGGTDGAAKVTIERGVFALHNDNSTNLLRIADIGKPVFATSPDTVSRTGTTHAGTLIGFDNDGKPLVDTTQAASNSTP